ncbi:hypothetical protein Kpho02_59920 [Kitasatospora phosalacinea]|uniref:Uncharacterized protein n=1 Tax=Kitasatospora phosalacinea TaxID=2065 RepID=A0A9W6QCL4_9ACTN|nr:hypothetical protein [Kitasatospora phosalacinea]GLW73694.1 hypothetical protein Kpho02_59920 [Kitasatospora phosalacinea]
MKHRARTSSPARRTYYEAASYRRWVARQIGPRRVGGLYRTTEHDPVYEVLAIEAGPRTEWPTWQITVRTLGETRIRMHNAAWEGEVAAEPGEQALAYWADFALSRPADDGALLEQRHVLDEALNPDLAAAFHRLASTAQHAA